MQFSSKPKRLFCFWHVRVLLITPKLGTEAIAAANFDEVGYKTDPLMAGKNLGSVGNYCRPLDTVQVLLIGWWMYTWFVSVPLLKRGRGCQVWVLVVGSISRWGGG